MQIECYTRSKETTAYTFLENVNFYYYTNVDEKKVSDNKLFWKVIKPSLSDKSCVKEKIHLVEKENFKNRFRDSRSFKYFFWKYI